MFIYAIGVPITGNIHNLTMHQKAKTTTQYIKFGNHNTKNYTFLNFNLSNIKRVRMCIQRVGAAN